MTAQAATADQVAGLLGEVDAITMERILAIGASLAEVHEALEIAQDEQGFGDERHPPSTPRVAEVRAVIDELADDDAEQDER